MSKQERSTELATRAISGDKNAWGELYTLYSDYLRHIAKQTTRNEADAEEVVQDVFLKGFEKVKGLRDPKAFSGWIRRVTIRIATNAVVRWSNKTATNVDSTVFANIQAGAEEPNNILDIEASGIRGGIAKLCEIDREILESYYFGYTSKLQTIAERLNITNASAKRRLCVARQRLKAILVEC